MTRTINFYYLLDAILYSGILYIAVVIIIIDAQLKYIFGQTSTFALRIQLVPFRNAYII